MKAKDDKGRNDRSWEPAASEVPSAGGEIWRGELGFFQALRWGCSNLTKRRAKMTLSARLQAVAAVKGISMMPPAVAAGREQMPDVAAVRFYASGGSAEQMEATAVAFDKLVSAVGLRPLEEDATDD